MIEFNETWVVIFVIESRLNNKVYCWLDPSFSGNPKNAVVHGKTVHGLVGNRSEDLLSADVENKNIDARTSRCIDIEIVLNNLSFLFAIHSIKGISPRIWNFKLLLPSKLSIVKIEVENVAEIGVTVVLIDWIFIQSEVGLGHELNSLNPLSNTACEQTNKLVMIARIVILIHKSDSHSVILIKVELLGYHISLVKSKSASQIVVSCVGWVSGHEVSSGEAVNFFEIIDEEPKLVFVAVGECVWVWLIALAVAFNDIAISLVNSEKSVLTTWKSE